MTFKEMNEVKEFLMFYFSPTFKKEDVVVDIYFIHVDFVI